MHMHIMRVAWITCVIVIADLLQKHETPGQRMPPGDAL